MKTVTTLPPVDGTYVQVADVSGDEKYLASAPYDVVVVPARLPA